MLVLRPVHGHADVGGPAQWPAQAVQQRLARSAGRGARAGPELVIVLDGVLYGTGAAEGAPEAGDRRFTKRQEKISFG